MFSSSYISVSYLFLASRDASTHLISFSSGYTVDFVYQRSIEIQASSFRSRTDKRSRAFSKGQSLLPLQLRPGKRRQAWQQAGWRLTEAEDLIGTTPAVILGLVSPLIASPCV